MPKFITRVELHNARSEDYANLHTAMLNRKFQKTISDDNGVQYELPTAEYFSYGPTITVGQVRDLALEAANSTGRPNWILVSEFNSAAWSLKPVKSLNALADLLSKNPSAGLGPANPLSTNSLSDAMDGRSILARAIGLPRE